MALFEVNPLGHWSTHSASYNEYSDAHNKQFVANTFFIKRERKKKKKITRSAS